MDEIWWTLIGALELSSAQISTSSRNKWDVSLAKTNDCLLTNDCLSKLPLAPLLLPTLIWPDGIELQRKDTAIKCWRGRAQFKRRHYVPFTSLICWRLSSVGWQADCESVEPESTSTSPPVWPWLQRCDISWSESIREWRCGHSEDEGLATPSFLLPLTLPLLLL